MNNSLAEQPKADDTREALILAGLRLFGTNGFEGTSTRAIAREAKANSAMIAYYFGGKEGLRTACAEWVVTRIGRLAGSVSVPPPEQLTPDKALDVMERILRTMAPFAVASQEAFSIVSFMMREMMQPSKSIDHVYGELIRPMHKRFCMLWAAATGMEAEAPETRLAVFSLIGQMLYFRIAREAVLRRMGWNDITVNEANRIADTLTINLRAIVADARARQGAMS